MNTAYGESRSCAVLGQRSAGGRGRILRLERAFDFECGQSIGLSDDPLLAPRRYSVASGRDEPWFDVLYTVVEDGALTPRLDLLREGDGIRVYEPVGAFSDSGEGRVWWIANGTGVAAFASFFRSGIRANRALIHGVRTSAEAYFSDEFRAAAGAAGAAEAGGFQYVVCASQGGDAPASDTAPASDQALAAVRGRLTDWLVAEGPKRFGAGDRFMLCGSSGMVVDAREILIGLGYRHDDIDCEIYF